MHSEKYTPIVQQTPPIWLKISVIFLVALGIFFRFEHLEKKAIWFDESFTLLAISGHTIPEVKQEIINNGVVSITSFDQYQHLNPERGVIDTVRYLITSDPQHPPLYYGLARLWVQVFGDSVIGVRSLSAAIALLIFPSVYWLCIELFDAPLVGWIAMALMAISPLEIFFAQDARQYGLWMVTILVSSAAILRTLRRETFLNWAIYSLALVIGLYTHLLTVLVAITHGIYVFSQQHFRFNKTLSNYLIATFSGLLLFTPWVFVFISNLSLAKQLTSFLSSLKVDNPVDLITIILSEISRIFFDLNLGSDIPWISLSFNEIGQSVYSLISVIFSLLLILSLWYFFIYQGINQSDLFLILLTLVPFLCLLLPDLFFGGVRSTIVRYQMPLYLSLQITVAALLSVYLLSEKQWQKRFFQLITIGLISAGLISDVAFYKADTWWIQIGNKGAVAIAKYLNEFENPLYLTSNHFSNIGDLLIFNHLFNLDTKILVVPDGELPNFWPEANYIFLLDDSGTMANNKNLITQFQENKNYSINYVDELSTELWAVQKNHD